MTITKEQEYFISSAIYKHRKDLERFGNSALMDADALSRENKMLNTLSVAINNPPANNFQELKHTIQESLNTFYEQFSEKPVLFDVWEGAVACTVSEENNHYGRHRICCNEGKITGNHIAAFGLLKDWDIEHAYLTMMEIIAENLFNQTTSSESPWSASTMKALDSI